MSITLVFKCSLSGNVIPVTSDSVDKAIRMIAKKVPTPCELIKVQYNEYTVIDAGALNRIYEFMC